jgi:mRNA interferase RelE/StbE
VANYELRIKPSALKELQALQIGDRRRIVERIEALAEDVRPPGASKLAGGDRYRVRQGVFRILYEIDDAASIVTVVKIGHRRDVYR